MAPCGGATHTSMKNINAKYFIIKIKPLISGTVSCFTIVFGFTMIMGIGYCQLGKFTTHTNDKNHWFKLKFVTYHLLTETRGCSKIPVYNILFDMGR
jgi:hypothetical protein